MTGRSAHQTSLGALLAVATMVLSGCGGTSISVPAPAPTGSAPAAAPAAPTRPTATPQPTKVTFALPVPAPDPGQIWAFLPKKAGYYAQEGLDVEFVPQQGGGAAQKLVATGQAEFSIGSAENLENGVLEGMDLRAVATVLTRQIFRFVVTPESPITAYAQLKGKKVGVASFTTGAYPFAKFALKENGLDPNKDVEFVTVGTGGPSLEALRSKRVDVLATWDTQIAIFSGFGAKVRELPLTSNASYPADTIIVRGELLRTKPDLVARFARAVMKGIVFAIENPEAATDYFIQTFPESAKGQTKESLVSILKSRVNNMSLQPSQQNKWGYVPIGDYEKALNASVALGTVKSTMDISKIFTNELSDKITAFSVEQVREEARKAK